MAFATALIVAIAATAVGVQWWKAGGEIDSETSQLAGGMFMGVVFGVILTGLLVLVESALERP